MTDSSGIVIHVSSRFLPEHSRPEAKRWFFAYRVRIVNEGHQPATVQRRHWVITDARGQVEEVEGAGIIGATPWLPPTAAFEYTSFCPLPTPSGSMCGRLAMSRDDGSEFEVEIPPFEMLSDEAMVQ
jgi:ApaG protein